MGQAETEQTVVRHERLLADLKARIERLETYYAAIPNKGTPPSSP